MARTEGVGVAIGVVVAEALLGIGNKDDVDEADGGGVIGSGLRALAVADLVRDKRQSDRS